MHTFIHPGYDRTPLFVRHWTPGNAPRAVVVLVHGYAEHGGRYRDVAERFAERGFATVAYDQRGHGRSGGPTALVRAFDEYVADLHAVVRHSRAEYPNRPLFLMGHSMGGAVVLLYVLDHGARPAGLVLSSPMITLLGPRLLQRGAPLLGRLAPALPTVSLDVDALSRNAAVVREVKSDPLCYSGLIKAGTGAAMTRATWRIDARMERLTLPHLLLHGTADRLTDPAGSRALARRARSADGTFTEYDGFYHETFNDPGGTRVHRQITDWIDARAAPEPSNDA